MDNLCTATPPVSDEEIIAGLLQLARSRKFRAAKPLLAEGERMYPDEPKERVFECLRRLSTLLWENDHGGHATAYMRLRRRPRSSLATHA